MNRTEVENLLQEFHKGQLGLDEVVDRLSGLRLDNLGHSRFDAQRELRSGLPEAIYAEGKKVEQLLDLIASALENSNRVLVSRLLAEQVPAIRESFPQLEIDEEARIAVFGGVEPVGVGEVLIVTAGTSDSPIAREVDLSVQFLGVGTARISDIGVAGLPRLLGELPRIRQADVVVVIAGMEGALPGVISGLIEAPVIAVPTSVGYGASFKGIAALLGMLVSCSPGVTVVNIDNGFGAALAAVKIIRLMVRRAEQK